MKKEEHLVKTTKIPKNYLQPIGSMGWDLAFNLEYTTNGYREEIRDWLQEIPNDSWYFDETNNNVFLKGKYASKFILVGYPKEDLDER